MSDSKKQNITAIGKDINIDARTMHVHNDNPLTPERLEKMIQLERKEAVEEYKKANNHNEKIEPLQKIKIFDDRLADMPSYYKEVQELITVLKDILENMLKDILEIGGNEFLVGKLAIAQNALEKGDFSKSDDLFAEIESREELALKPAARIAVARGEIARQVVRWHDAAKHFFRAAQLDPCFETLNMAGKLAIDIGNYSSALSLGLDAQKAAIKEYGKDGKEYAISLNNLAGIFQEQGQYEKAKLLHEEALNIKRVELGDNHPSTANSIHNLAEVYQKLGKPEKSETLNKKALDIREKTLGDNHPDTISSLNNLAQLYSENGRNEEAEPLYQKALKISKQILGKNHPNTAGILNNLAMLYEAHGLPEDAEPLYQESLKIFQATLGHNHQVTKTIKANYEDFLKKIP